MLARSIWNARTAIILWAMVVPFVVLSGCARSGSVEADEAGAEPEVVIFEQAQPVLGEGPVPEDFELRLEDEQVRQFPQVDLDEPEEREIIDCVFAELDGEEPLEVILHLERRSGDGGIEHCFIACSVRDPEFLQPVASFLVTPPLEGEIHFEVVDLDSDGKDEVLVLDSDAGTGFVRRVSVLVLGCGQFRDLVRDFEHGVAWIGGSAASCDIAPVEVVSIKFSGNLPLESRSITLRRIENGFYFESVVNPVLRGCEREESRVTRAAVMARLSGLLRRGPECKK